MPMLAPILAEVSDKLMSWPATIVWTVVIVAAGWALIRKKKWLAIIPLPFAVLFALGSYETWTDQHMRPAVIKELGISYLLVGFVPLLAILTLLAGRKKKPKNSQSMPAAIDIKAVTMRIEIKISAMIADVVWEKYWVTHYGANDIHPKHLVYWICVQSDTEKKRLKDDSDLYQKLRSLLADCQYPLTGRNEVHIGFESQETVDRESGGNWWHHWK